MRFSLSNPRKLASGKRASYWGVRITLESAYEEQAARQLYPTLGKSPKGRDSKGETEKWLSEVRRAVEHRAHLLSMGMPVQDTALAEKRAAEFIEWGKTQGGKKGHAWGEGHAEHVREYLREWFAVLGIKTLSEVRQAPFDREIVKLARTFAPNTVNHRARCLTALCSWAVRQGYLPAHPLKFRSLDKTPKQERGAYTLEELRALFQGVPWGRGLLYRSAYYLRLRRNELASLTVGSALWSEGIIKLDAKSAKDRKTAFIPVPEGLMADLWASAQGKPDDAPLFDFSKKHAARVLHRDCARLGIPTMSGGRRRDFHSLGASTATSMSRHKIAPALAQKTMRHKSWAQTEAYIKLETEEVRAVTQGLENEIEHTDDADHPKTESESIQMGTKTLSGSSPSPSALSRKTLKFRTDSRNQAPKVDVTWAKAREILAHCEHTLRTGGADDLAAFLKLSKTQRAALIASAKKAVG